MAEIDHFPYRAEYAKSSRASCRKCKGTIQKDSLRLAVLVQSPSFDGKIPYWYHYMCFFALQRPSKIEDIAHFDSLRWDDQKKIKEKLANGPSTSNKSKKPGKNSQAVDNDFLLEYAKSSRATCKGCEEKIDKGVIRISKKDYESVKAKRFGPIPMWHHVHCFVAVRNELEFYDSCDAIPGLNTLSAEDKKMLREKIPKIAGKRKAEDEPDTGTKKIKTENDSKLKNNKTETDSIQEKQNKKMFSYRDLLKKNLKKSEMVDLLAHNCYVGLSGEEKMLDVLADLMTFGNIDVCTVCKTGNLIYQFGVGYKCTGDLSEWTKCNNVVDKPERKPFLVPEEFKEAFPFLKKYKYKKYGDRVICKRVNKQDSTSSESNKSAPLKPLANLTFVVTGSTLENDEQVIRQNIRSLGGSISLKVDEDTAAVITTQAETLRKTKDMKKAKALGIHCVTEDFLSEVQQPDDVLIMIKKKNIAPWECKGDERITHLKKSGAAKKVKSGSTYENLPEKIQITLKNGDFIDPSSGLSDYCHVYKRNARSFSVVLGLVDLSKGINSYYRLQLLESDNKKSYHIYRSWGRIGTTIGDNKIEEFHDFDDAFMAFNSLYEQKTGHKFNSKHQNKLPGMWYPLDIVFGEEKSFKKIDASRSKSKLPLPVKELINLLFDVDTMKSTMVQFELDLKKMPLGKLSPKQLENAYKVLSEALEWIAKRDQKESDVTPQSDLVSIKSYLLDCSNRFYTLIPHDFGMMNPPLLDNEELIKSKIDMIDSLREIELAYSLLKSEGDDKLDPIDLNYEKLKTKIEVVDKSSEEFNMIKMYIKNTHAETHRHYDLVLDEVFKVAREGETKRFKPFKKLHNRQLLWHGSRLTNFVGILSQGLRIAPPEAPATGYMFGKGVYFADMVSKSANYCFTSANNTTGLLLLSDVALGNMHELTRAKYISKLPSGKHSTKGLGRTCPDPSKTISIEDGIQVPLGNGQPSKIDQTDLLYNEYIVYDASQINIKYLLRTTFKYKY